MSDSKPSPFDYTNNSLLYIANDIPLYGNNKEESLNATLERIIKLCDITNGRTLVLFTAKEDLWYIQTKLRKRSTAWEQIYQTEGPNQERQIARFKSSGGVLFGSGIFWEGINIPGQQLSQVIIVRLPFPVPKDPIMEYKVSNSSDPMNHIFLPEMLIRLRQGTGRLIRQEEDKGIISILDSRLSNLKGKSYRQSVLSALPFKTTTESLERLTEFAAANL